MYNPFIPRRIQYQGEPTPTFSPKVNSEKLAEAIRINETGGVKKNAYSFRQPSNSGIPGDMANGAYQVTDAELATYAPRYLGKAVTPQQFLNDPTMQDNYMRVKATALGDRGLTPEQIMAVHRGGASDLTPQALTMMVQKYQPYVIKGMMNYTKQATPQISSRFGNSLDLPKGSNPI